MKRLALFLLIPSLAFGDASLTLGGTASDAVGFGTLSSYAGSPMTVLGWYRPTTFTSPRRLWAKQATSFLICQVLATGTGGIRCRNDRTVAQAYDTSACFASTSQWYFIAITFDESASANNFFHIYQGIPGGNVSECAYAARTDGSGTWGDYTANNLVAGNSSGLSQPFQGQIAFFMVVNRVLTLSEVQDQQYTPHIVSGTLVFSDLGFDGTGTQKDLSGSGNSGTVTSAVVSAIGPPISVGGNPQ